MNTVTFDTLKASRNLKAAGFDEPQADAIIDTFGDAFSDTVATKTDIAEVKADIAKLEGFTKAEIAEVKADIAKLAKLAVATKADIDKLAVATKADIDKLAVATKAEIANLKAEMFRALWIQGAALVGLQLTIAGLLFAALKMFSHF
jgi:hypothetical protein